MSASQQQQQQRRSAGVELRFGQHAENMCLNTVSSRPLLVLRGISLDALLQRGAPLQRTRASVPLQRHSHIHQRGEKAAKLRRRLKIGIRFHRRAYSARVFFGSRVPVRRRGFLASNLSRGEKKKKKKKGGGKE